MDLRDIYESLGLADRLSLRSCSRLHAQLPVTCEMTWDYKVDPVPMPPRAYSRLRKRQRIDYMCTNKVQVPGGRCVDCCKFSCVWHSSRLTFEGGKTDINSNLMPFRRVTLCMPCQHARSLWF